MTVDFLLLPLEEPFDFFLEFHKEVHDLLFDSTWNLAKVCMHNQNFLLNLCKKKLKIQMSYKSTKIGSTLEWMMWSLNKLGILIWLLQLREHLLNLGNICFDKNFLSLGEDRSGFNGPILYGIFLFNFVYIKVKKCLDAGIVNNF